MVAQRIDGKAIAASVRGRLKAAVQGWQQPPGLAVILVGDDPASQVYVRGKERAAKEVGMGSWVYRLPASVAQGELLALIERLNQAPEVDGLLVQLPLPAHIDERAVLWAIDPDKDVDGFHPLNVGRLNLGHGGLAPCTPQGVLVLLDEIGFELRGKEAVVVGRSQIVGRPLAQMLLARDATVTLCHSRTADLAKHTRQADLLVAAVGKAGLITGEMVKPGAVVIDVGMNRLADGRLVGDVDAPSVASVAGWLTPVPRGVGPMTIAMLLANTMKAAEARRCGKS